MRKPEHINIYIIIRRIFFSCANPPTTLFILINSGLEMGQSWEIGPWGLPSQTQTIAFFLLRKQRYLRRKGDETAAGRDGSAPRPFRSLVISTGCWAAWPTCVLFPASLFSSSTRKGVRAPCSCGCTGGTAHGGQEIRAVAVQYNSNENNNHSSSCGVSGCQAVHIARPTAALQPGEYRPHLLGYEPSFGGLFHHSSPTYWVLKCQVQ